MPVHQLTIQCKTKCAAKGPNNNPRKGRLQHCEQLLTNNGLHLQRKVTELQNGIWVLETQSRNVCINLYWVSGRTSPNILLQLFCHLYLVQKKKKSPFTTKEMILRPKLVNSVRITWGAKISSIKVGKILYFLKSYDFYHKEDQNFHNWRNKICSMEAFELSALSLICTFISWKGMVGKCEACHFDIVLITLDLSPLLQGHKYSQFFYSHKMQFVPEFIF